MTDVLKMPVRLKGQNCFRAPLCLGAWLCPIHTPETEGVPPASVAGGWDVQNQVNKHCIHQHIPLLTAITLNKTSTDLYAFCVSECLECASVNHLHARFLQRLEEDVGSPGTRVTDDCEPLCRFWESNPGTLEGQPVLLTSVPFLKHLSLIFKAQTLVSC